MKCPPFVRQVWYTWNNGWGAFQTLAPRLFFENICNAVFFIADGFGQGNGSGIGDAAFPLRTDALFNAVMGGQGRRAFGVSFSAFSG